MPINLRPSLLVATAALVALAACQVSPTSSSPSTGPASGPRVSGTIPVNPATPGPSAGGAIDVARVNQVLGPAVGEVIVNPVRGNPALGSGFVIAHAGGDSMMVTNNHVVTGAAKIQVLMPDGKHFVAQLQGTDATEDIAVIRIPDNTLPLAQFGDSTKLQVGQPVVAIGNPEGQTGSVTSGIISAVHRTISAGTGAGAASEDLPDVIQTDAAINPGNSGGPLADAQGLVIGVNVAGDSQANNIGFAIPSLVAKRIAEALMAGKTAGHPYVGVRYQDLASALIDGHSVNGYGILVSCAVSGSPADRGGVKAGDVVEKVDGVDLNNGNTLGGVLQLHNPGDTVPFVVQRGSGTTTLHVTLGDRPANPPSC
jgi:putative serine protease PepD